MFYGVARLEILVPQSQSLKDKRSVLRRLRDRLGDRLGLVVTEVDHQDLRQRAAVGIAVIALSEHAARNALQAARREAEADPRVEVIGCDLLVDRFEGSPDWGLGAGVSGSGFGDGLGDGFDDDFGVARGDSRPGDPDDEEFGPGARREKEEPR